MKTLLIQVLISLGIMFQAVAYSDYAGLLSSIEENTFTMKVYQRQGKMIAVHLKNKTSSEKISIKILDAKNNLLHSEYIAGSKIYVKKFDLSSLKGQSFKVSIKHAGVKYQSDVEIKEFTPQIKIYERPQNIVAIQTEKTYSEQITVHVTDANSGSEIIRKQWVSPGKSVSKFDFSKIDTEIINIKVVVNGEVFNEKIKLL